MTAYSTTEAIGRLVLLIFKEKGKYAGDLLQYGLLQAKIESENFAISELNQGLEWLKAQGFVEQKSDDKQALLLTDKGFDKLQFIR
ncbi:hypothetical protein [Vibrio sp.]|uniref:hypothetical protein n=1 Tax=Vibrio sp. TaxID=678 RepID=UPI003D1016CD